MRTLALVSALGLAVVLSGSVPVVDAATKTLSIEAYGPGEGYHFEFNGNDTPNPTIALAAGDSVVVTFSVNENATASHNFHVGAPVSKEIPCCLAGGTKANFEFDVPATATGDIAYWCSLHKGSGMQGTFRVASASGTFPTASAPASTTPGFETLLAFAAVGIAIAARRRLNV